MKLLELATSTAKKVVRPTKAATKKRRGGAFSAEEERRLDPFHRDDERRAEVNARSSRTVEDWIPRRARNWLRRDGGW